MTKHVKRSHYRVRRFLNQYIKPRPARATNRVHDFALKYFERIENPSLPKGVLFEDLLDECASFCFDSFFCEAAARGGVQNLLSEFGAPIEFQDLDNIMFIGASIFAKWRAIFYWSYNDMEPLKDSERVWFRFAFLRLAQVTEAKYSKKKSSREVLVLYQVEFEEDGKRYTYASDTDKYALDDFVIVPAGSENREALVRIKAMKYYRYRDLPYVQKNWKRILRKAEGAEEEFERWII